MLMTPAETKFLFDALTPETDMLEYGSGDGTRELISRVRSLVSIEHDPKWFMRTKEGLFAQFPVDTKWNIYHYPPSMPYDETRDGDGSLCQFFDYVTAPVAARSAYTYDVILIDGRARVACALVCPLLLRNNGRVFIHDWPRDYSRALETLRLERCVETLAKFTIRK